MAVSPARALARAFAASKERSTAAPKRFAAASSCVKACITLHLRQALAGIGGRLRQRVLRLARQRPDRAAISHERQHDHRNGDQHGERQFRAGHHHHDGGAGQEQHIAQRLRDHRARRSLDLRRIGGEPRHHLARMRHLVEGGAQAGQMLEHVAADVGDHPLAEPVDRVEARGAGQCEDQADAGQRDEIFIDQVGIDAGEAEIDHAPDGKRHGERGRGRDHQRGEQRPRASPCGAADRAASPSSGRNETRLAAAVFRRRHRCRSRRSPPSVCGVTSCTNKGPALRRKAQTLRAQAALAERVRCRAHTAQPCAAAEVPL